MSALAPGGLCLSRLTCRLGARRQVPHDGLVEANSAYRCNEVTVFDAAGGGTPRAPLSHTL
jgi:hypothetical protein